MAAGPSGEPLDTDTRRVQLKDVVKCVLDECANDVQAVLQSGVDGSGEQRWGAPPSWTQPSLLFFGAPRHAQQTRQ